MTEANDTTNPNPIASSGAPDTQEPPSRAEKLEQDASLAAVVVGAAFRAVDVAAVVLVGLLVSPPLAILVVVVVAPLLVMALVLGLLAAVLSTPYLLVDHFREWGAAHGGSR